MAATFNYFDFAIGALAAKQPSNDRAEALLQGRTSIKVGSITLDNSYPTGGYPASSFGMKNLNFVAFQHPPGYMIAYNSTTNKVQVFDTGASSGAAFTEVAAATNLSTVQPVPFMAVGTF